MSASTFQSGQYCQAQSSCHAYLYPKKMFQLLQSAYSTISIQDAALFLGMNEDEATTSMSIFGGSSCEAFRAYSDALKLAGQLAY
ncbi:hypothetical protein GBA52_003935 [Prunus armeniaca]|nr:hypothetical protein GBA52_003935 [Prunus armeniaca]